MNTAEILRNLATMAPDCIGPHIERLDGDVYRLIWMRQGGMLGCVQFTPAGIYGAMFGSVHQTAKSDIELAAELAKAVRQ